MKKAILMLVLLAGIMTVVNAQPQKSSITVVIKTPTVQCEQCKQKIENYLAKEEGIIKAVSDYKRKTVKVTFYTERTNLEAVKTAIANAGYDADDVAANPDSYKKLPLCCKKPEDGGGMGKKQN